MTSFSKIEIRRCRLLLGTFVEITASGPDEIKIEHALSSAFAAILRVQNLMSAHNVNSELSRINREAAKRPVAVSREMFAVLSRAHQLASQSEGAFDYTVAPTLARWGFLPKKSIGACQLLAMFHRTPVARGAGQPPCQLHQWQSHRRRSDCERARP